MPEQKVNLSIASQRGSVPKMFPTSRRFSRGDLIGGKYRLMDPVGAGAMGMVWVAKNELLDVDVAVKLLRVVDTQRADPQKLYQRLLQEARAAARLGHPGIVRIFDFGQEDDNTPFIVMELLEGESLAVLMNRQRQLPVREAIQMLLPIADALATAHGRGIVHRDVKPENIFLARDEYGRVQPKIVDFGVARFAEGRCVTRSGALMGTPDYMAPEQARGEEDIDHRVDVWALGVVLYELMVGRRPFASDGSHYLAVLRSIVHERPPSILEHGVGDAALWLILERSLRKNRRERWDTMRVFGEALALWLYEHGVREDLLGASLKTTWLQSGLDGIKIETSSMFPPKPEAEPPERVASIEVVVGSVQEGLVFDGTSSAPSPRAHGSLAGSESEPTRGATTVPPMSRRRPPAPRKTTVPRRVASRSPLGLVGLFLTAFLTTSVVLLALDEMGRAIGFARGFDPLSWRTPTLQDDGSVLAHIQRSVVVRANPLEVVAPKLDEPSTAVALVDDATAPVARAEAPTTVRSPPRRPPAVRRATSLPSHRTRQRGLPAASTYDFGF